MSTTISSAEISSEQPPPAPAGMPSENPAAFQLPEQPLVVIQPSTSWRALNLVDIWRYRELLYFLTWRDLKVRYKQTILGVAWVVMQPLLSTLIFTIFLGKFARIPSDNVPYPLLVFAGLMPWTFFSGAISSASNSLVGSAHLISKVYFPRMIIPAASIAARLVDFLLALGVLIAIMLYYGVPFTYRLLILPLLMLLTTLLSLAIGMWTSALNVKYRDVGVALPVLTMLWMFASPVVYPSSIVYASVSSTSRFLYSLNPLVGIIDNFRAALLGRPFNWPALWATAIVTAVSLVLSAYHFRRMEREFADIV